MPDVNGVGVGDRQAVLSQTLDVQGDRFADELLGFLVGCCGGTDDFWSYAALAAVAWIRAVAADRAQPLSEICGRLRNTPTG